MITTLATVAAVAFGLPLVVLGVECWLSLLPLRRHVFRCMSEPRFAVVIPAHNEEGLISGTVHRIREQMSDAAEVIVIADNCHDDTAELARVAGATVLERADPGRMGKGYALNFAWERLRELPLDVVVYVDADCTPEPNCIRTIAQLAHERQRPVQSAYTMESPPTSSGLTCISALAVHVKNVVRSRGLQRLGLPCLLTGSGMAIPVAVLAKVPFPGGHVAEDTRVSIDLTIAGFPPLPCMEAGITSLLPERRSGFTSQRTRWEHGHLKTIFTGVPKLLSSFVRNKSWPSLVLFLELFVPPLSLMAMGSAVLLMVLFLLCQVLNSWLPLFAYLATIAIGASGLVVAWLTSARHILPASTVLRIPEYIAVKAPMYLRFIHRRQRDWVRTERDQAIASSKPDVAPPAS